MYGSSVSHVEPKSCGASRHQRKHGASLRPVVAYASFASRRPAPYRSSRVLPPTRHPSHPSHPPHRCPSQVQLLRGRSRRITVPKSALCWRGGKVHLGEHELQVALRLPLRVHELRREQPVWLGRVHLQNAQRVGRPVAGFWSCRSRRHRRCAYGPRRALCAAMARVAVMRLRRTFVRCMGACSARPLTQRPDVVRCKLRARNARRQQRCRRLSVACCGLPLSAAWRTQDNTRSRVDALPSSSLAGKNVTSVRAACNIRRTAVSVAHFEFRQAHVEECERLALVAAYLRPCGCGCMCE